MTAEFPGPLEFRKGIDAYYSLAQHGDLANRPDDFPALLELLESGSTTRLPSQPPAVRRDSSTPYAIPSEAEDILPNERDLAAAALGGSGAPDNVSSKQPEQRVHVEVVHGDLSFARHTVAAGHYTGDSIVGAEALLDHHLGGRLSLHNQLGVYPDRIGTADVFLASDKKSRPSGAIIMGLGKIGELTPKSLEETYYSAMLKYALAAKECQDNRFRAPGSDAVTTLLVGTMANVLTVEECLTAMLRAIRTANAALDSAASPSSSKPAFRIRSVEVIELWEDRAILTAEALARISATPEMKDVLDRAREVTTRQGGLRRYTSGGEEAWWSRLRINQKQDPGLALDANPLSFSLITNRARAELEEVPEPERAAALIESASQSPSMDEKVSQALFEMLVPNRLKEYAPELTRLVLMVDQNSARYPWELMQDRLGRRKRPLSVDAALIRQLEVDDYRPVVQQSGEDTALVVANPQTTKYKNLPGAQAEGDVIAAELGKSGVRVKPHIHSTGALIRRDLYTGTYRILHFAGHGVQQYKAGDNRAPVSGMVIGDNDFLTPAEIKQLRPVPELVFINCCHLGRTDIAAANLAVAFIKMGVRAVIAAGWAIDDGAATTFAKQFYRSFLGGAIFGEAVRIAREETYRQHPAVNTWGAYQCYGDPGYRFRIDSQGAAGSSVAPKLVLPSQLALELENLARSSKEKDQVSGRQQIEEKLRRSSRRWAKRPNGWTRAKSCRPSDVSMESWANIPKAVENYAAAAQVDFGEFPVRAVEQEANCRVRGATEAKIAGEDR